MHVNSISTYSIIAILGSVIAGLYYWVSDADQTALKILYITVYLLAGLRFFLEWRYYRSHNAIIASSQFILLPSLVVVFGMVVTSNVNSITIIFLSFSVLSGIHATIFMSVISLSIIPPVYILHYLHRKYNLSLWMGFAVHKKLFSRRLVPYVLQSIVALSLFYLSSYFGVIDLIAIIPALVWVFQTIKYYIVPRLPDLQRSSSPNPRMIRTSSAPNGTRRKKRRNKLTRSLRDPAIIPPGTLSATTAESTVTQSTRNTTSRLRRSPTTNYNGRKPKTSYSGSRTISSGIGSRARNILNSSSSNGESKKESRKSARVNSQNRRQKKNNSSSRSSVVELAPARELRSIRGKRTSSSKGLMPNGSALRRADLNCMYCYGEFKKDDTKVVICPNCKYPGHESEYENWIQVSDLCARCSRKIPNLTSPKYLVDVEDYIENVIKKVKR